MISLNETPETKHLEVEKFITSHEFWDLGEADVIRMSDKALANVLRCLIHTGGTFTSAYEIDGHYKNPNLNSVLFRVRLPVGKRTEFEFLSGYRLTPIEPAGAH